MAFLRRTYALALLVLLAGFHAQANAAEELQLQEQEIKAGLLYNFLKYTDWPPEKLGGAQVAVCIFGDDPFEGYLEPMGGRSVNQREIAIRKVRSADEAGECNLLFVNAEEKENWPQLRKALAGKGVLTVSDFAHFAETGGMIEFGHRNDHISASLNINAVNAAKLHVQDRLLKLVTIIHTAEGH